MLGQEWIQKYPQSQIDIHSNFQKYQHKKINGDIINVPPGKVVCIGRNYSEHIAELGNVKPEDPLLFIKPTTAIQDFTCSIDWPNGYGECHYETEISVLILDKITKATIEEVRSLNFYFGVALDLTLRDLQQKLKSKGEPWEKAKAYDGSCVLSAFDDSLTLSNIQNAKLELYINNELRQQDVAHNMITPVDKLIAYASQFFTLLPGDVILTGTPKGVGPLKDQDKLTVSLNDFKNNAYVNRR